MEVAPHYNTLGCFNFFWISASMFSTRVRLGKTRLHAKFLDPKMSQGHPSEVLHCNYDGEISQKFDLVITIDWRVLLT